MSYETITYEQPVNELVRVCLRLEHIFKQIHLFATEPIPQNVHIIIKLIIDLLNLLDRPDLKNKLIKELNRQIINFNQLRNIDDIDQLKLSDTIKQFEQSARYCLSIPGKLMQHLRNNEFLAHIRQNLLNPGGDSCIDLPDYHYWLQLPWETQKQQLHFWLEQFNDIKQAIFLLINTIRDSAESKCQIGEKGFYHASLDTHVPCQLIRVALDSRLHLFPEISVGKYHMSIRFLIPSLDTRPKQTEEDIEFELICCVI
ncbi:MAG: cell division protein ZapD [Gammaproteobacteria bacterium]|nr:cell division protein ZapD [Gammaproteobacteria bacterium]